MDHSHSTDIAQRITNQLIELLDQVDHNSGELPWHRVPVRALKPLNPLTGTVYRGINWIELMLASGGGIHLGIITQRETYPSARWATYRQWLAAGCQVRKGSLGTGVVFFKSYQRQVTSDTGESETQERKALRCYTVFAAEQVDGAEGHLPQQTALAPDAYLVAAEQVVNASGATINFGGNRAMYCETSDGRSWIQMPERHQFPERTRYYSVLFHELTHWTKSYVGRDAYLAEHFSDLDERRAFEELVAELGAAMLCGYTQIDNAPRDDHAAYIKSWLPALRSDRTFIMRAAAQAQKAVDYLVTRSGLNMCEASAAPASADQSELVTSNIHS